MRNLSHSRLIFTFFISLLSGISIADTYLSVDFYPVKEDAYNGETPINAVMRLPKSSIIGSSKCFASFTENINDNDPPCPAEWMNFTKKCDAAIREAAVEPANKYGDDPPILFIARFSKEGGTVMVSRSFFGGSGGGKVDWSIFLLKWQENEKASCPSVPFMSGTEVQPGGNTWFESNCKNESGATCVERIFYPKDNAFRLEFNSTGTRMLKIPKDSKLPKEFGAY